MVLNTTLSSLCRFLNVCWYVALNVIDYEKKGSLCGKIDYTVQAVKV